MTPSPSSLSGRISVGVQSAPTEYPETAAWPRVRAGLATLLLSCPRKCRLSKKQQLTGLFCDRAARKQRPSRLVATAAEDRLSFHTSFAAASDIFSTGRNG